jgi:AcrR family transcriptional regulator
MAEARKKHSSRGGPAEGRDRKPSAAAKQRAQGAEPRTRQERAGERREAILAAALDEFSECGFAAARLDDVAKRAGVAKGTIYLHFRDKEHLFQEIVRAMIGPLVGSLEALGHIDLPMHELGKRIVDLFIREIYETRRRDVIRLIITEGRRFPHLAEFYHREVLSRIFAAMRVLLRRAVGRGEAPPGLVDYPQLVGAPALLAVVWSGLFERFEPLDMRAMLQTHVEILFGAWRKT